MSDSVYVLLCFVVRQVEFTLYVCALQAASLDKIASLVKNDVLTMEGLVGFTYIIFVFIQYNSLVGLFTALVCLLSISKIQVREMEMYLTTTDNIIRARGTFSISYDVLD